MKSILLFLLLGLTQILAAQTFTEKTGTPFEGVYIGSVTFSDVDTDKDPDLLVTGYSSETNRSIAKLYLNDGEGNFTEKLGTPFEAVHSSAIAFSDVDADDDPDLFITGSGNLGKPIAKLYLNDGLGNFAEKQDTPFEGVSFASIAFSDVNGDTHEDLFVIGPIDELANERIAKLYLNDGQGNFTEKQNTAFDEVLDNSIAFSDVDGDDAPDLFIAGSGLSRERNTKLYSNDGSGNFTEILDTPFEGVWAGSIALSDIDGDEDHDLLITGQNNYGEQIAKLYINDGYGNFTEKADTPFKGVWGASIAFSDVDGDEDQDLLIAGDENSGERIAKLYINDGQGNFKEKEGTPFDGVWRGSIAFSDVDGDNDNDLLLTGDKNSGSQIAKLYINDGTVSTDELNLHTSLDLQLFPNPSAPDRLYVNYHTSNEGEADIVIYDMKGGLAMEKQEWRSSGDQTLSIDISSLPQGSYVLELEEGERKGRAKFVVQ